MSEILHVGQPVSVHRRPLVGKRFLTSSRVLLALLLVFSLALLSLSARVPQTPASPGPQLSSSPVPGAERCAFCHQSEVEGYARSAMAHALRRAAQEPQGKVQLPHSTIAVTSNSSGTL